MADIDVYMEWLGIPKDRCPPDHYALLRLVRFEDDVEKITTFYKKLNAHVRKYATGAYSVRSQELLNELAKAMLCLTDSERKREYDESLGREFDDEANAGRKPLLRHLVETGTISREQVSGIEEFADARGLSHCDAVVQMKLTDRDTATRALSLELGLPFIDLEDMLPDDSVLDHVPRHLVKRHTILPLFVDDDVLLVACADQPEPEIEDEFRLRFGMPMHPCLATTRAINQAIAKYYAPGARDEAATDAPTVDDLQEVKHSRQPKKRAPAASKTPFSQLPADKQREKRLIGIIVICWTIVASVLLFNFLGPTLGLGWGAGAPLVMLSTAIAAAYVFLSLWK